MFIRLFKRLIYNHFSLYNFDNIKNVNNFDILINVIIFDNIKNVIMKNIVGQIASKEDFYPRPQEIRRIIRNLNAGANIQLTAPRRVGKSSILIHLQDYPPEGFLFVYIDVESARTKQDYYRKIYKEILRTEAIIEKKNLIAQLKEGTHQLLKKLKNVKIAGIAEIVLNEEEDVDYEEELLNFLGGIDLRGEKLVIMVDEFPEVLLNMVEDAKGEQTDARSFLQSNRAFRNQGTLRERVQFIYTGSNSLNVTAANLNSTELINDIPATPVNPLKPEEAKDLITQILLEYGYHIKEGEMNYLINRVEWFIPFYFQLVIQEIINYIDPEDEVSKEVIDYAMTKIADQQNDHHFEHYVKRLKRVFPESQLKFVKTFLNALAKSGQLSRDEVFNLGNTVIAEEEIKRVLNSLIYDGYIIKTTNETVTYKFNSPILKLWWYNHES